MQKAHHATTYGQVQAYKARTCDVKAVRERHHGGFLSVLTLAAPVARMTVLRFLQCQVRGVVPSRDTSQIRNTKSTRVLKLGHRQFELPSRFVISIEGCRQLWDRYLPSGICYHHCHNVEICFDGASRQQPRRCLDHTRRLANIRHP